MSRTFTTQSELQTQQLAILLTQWAYATDCITLTGDLGSGKTVFARAFIQALVGEITVQSPTFMLVIPYEYGNGNMLHHFDLYRVKHESELIELGFEDALNSSLCLIEWPQITQYALPDNRLDINIMPISDHVRTFECSAKGNWQDRLNKVYFSS